MFFFGRFIIQIIGGLIMLGIGIGCLSMMLMFLLVRGLFKLLVALVRALHRRSKAEVRKQEAAATASVKFVPAKTKKGAAPQWRGETDSERHQRISARLAEQRKARA